ncbi:MAG TPA: polymer-forming cytoskeletal protein [Candidatus Binatia bacterium]|nr:polymer-forming cytoskeletal protein [Candidatus Binatia bacterium]
MAKNFWGNSEKPGVSAVDTLIGRQTEIHGDVRFSGGLHIDGRVVGKVMSLTDKNATLSVSEVGSVEGNVRAPSVVLNGQVTGDVHASEHLSLGSKARVTGNVYYGVIEMTGGAKINGQLVHEGDEAMAALTHQKPVNEPMVEEAKPEGRFKA